MTSTPSARPTPNTLHDYKHVLTIPTRWADNDVYGHVNNVVYYYYFDTVVNEYLIQKGLLNIEKSQTIGLVVNTQCHYFSPVAFPDIIQAGLRVSRLGSSSVTYEIGLCKNEDTLCAAQGEFTHVYVDRDTRRPVKLSPDMRAALSLLDV